MNTERLTLLANRMALDVGTPAAHSYNQLALGTCAISYIDRTPELAPLTKDIQWEPSLSSALMGFFDLDRSDANDLFGPGPTWGPTHGEPGLVAAIQRIRRTIAQVDAEHQTPLPGQQQASEDAFTIAPRETMFEQYDDECIPGN